MNFRIVGQHTGKSKHLCKGCQHSTTMKFQNGNEVWRCRVFGTIIPKPVLECQQYYPGNVQTHSELENLAYIIDKDEEGEITIRKRGMRVRYRRVTIRRGRNPKPVIEETIQ